VISLAAPRQPFARCPGNPAFVRGAFDEIDRVAGVFDLQSDARLGKRLVRAGPPA